MTKNDLTSIPNIGKTLAEKLNRAGISNYNDLISIGSENSILRLETMGIGTWSLN